MNKLGIIDIGSNSIRVLIAEIKDNKFFKIVDEAKQVIRLGQDVDVNNNLSQDRINAAINCITEFYNMCKNLGASNIYAVATEALRKAPNGNLITDKIKEITTLDIRILSGEEEAYYGYLANTNAIDMSDYFFIDLGGSSMEVALVKNRELIKAHSFHLGAIAISKQFDFKDEVKQKVEDEFLEYVQSELDKIEWIKENKGLPFIGVGGTVRTIGKVHRGIVNYPLDLTHNYQVSLKDVEKIYDKLKDLNLKQKEEIKGLSKHRADIFIGGFLAILKTMKYCQSETLTISRCGVREGILYENLTKENDTSILLKSILNIAKNYNLDLDFNLQVYKIVKKLSNTLFKDQIKGIEKILLVSGLLYNIGLSVSLYAHNKHSYYLLLNSPLMGISQKEILMAAYIASVMDKEDFKLEDNYKDIVEKEDISICKKIGIVLLLAEEVAKYYNLKDENIDIEINDKTINLETNKSVTLNENVIQRFQEEFNKKLHLST